MPRHPVVPPRPVVSVPAAGFYHTVSHGETLYRIAKTYGVTVDDIKKANALSDNHLAPGQRLYIAKAAPVAFPPPAAARPLPGYVSLEEARRLAGPRSSRYAWYTITVHHSGTHKGSGSSFHRDHLRRRMGGLFYHFVVGNGSDTRDGEIEVGWRWKRQVRANRPNDIQICLVGNFDIDVVSAAQMESLTNLITVLRQSYGIPLNRVRGHHDIPGKHTDCPGTKFPMDRLRDRLRQLGGS